MTRSAARSSARKTAKRPRSKASMQIDTQLMLGFENMAPLELIAGIDEAGRGPLAGPVVAAAVILAPDHGIVGLNDSKKISEADREGLADEIRQKSVAWTIAEASVKEIDQINILHAAMLAMSRAAQTLEVKPRLALVDGNRLPALPCPGESVVKGDSRVECIAAASILAKVERDRIMRALDKSHPGYDWAQNKGYPTQAHMQALTDLGATTEHRRSFGPVRRVLEGT